MYPNSLIELKCMSTLTPVISNNSFSKLIISIPLISNFGSLYGTFLTNFSTCLEDKPFLIIVSRK